MNKLKVSTNSSNVFQKKDKIIHWLTQHEEGATPSMIAVGTGINVNTIKSILPKMQKVKSVTRGWYKVLIEKDNPLISCGELKDWNFHNLILQTQLKSYNPLDIKLNYNLIDINILINSKGKCTTRLSSDFPLNVSSICLVYAFLTEKLKPYTNDILTMKNINIRCIEFNKDYSNLKFEGVQCISLDGLCEQFKLYQKSIGLRVEHKTKVEFRVNNMVDMLTQSPNTLDLTTKLNQTEEQLKKLTTQSIYNTNQLNKILERNRK